MTDREGRTLKEQTATERPVRSPYDFVKGIDLENRELLDKPEGTGLFDLVKKGDGSYRCYACGLCEKTCPEDCIQVDYLPEYPEKAFDMSRERAAALAAAAGGVAQPELDMSKFDW